MNATSRVATIDDEFNHPLSDEVQHQLALRAATSISGQVDRVLMVTGEGRMERITHGELVDTVYDLVLGFRIVDDVVYTDVRGWRPLPADDGPTSAVQAPSPVPPAPVRRPVGPCPCACNHGGFCGGCGHAGCGGR